MKTIKFQHYPSWGDGSDPWSMNVCGLWNMLKNTNKKSRFLKGPSINIDMCIFWYRLYTVQQRVLGGCHSNMGPTLCH